MAAGRVGDSYGGYRAKLVEELRRKGIQDLAVLRAFSEVPRHVFVPEALRNSAYHDTSLPVGNGQTISQPSTHATYLQTLALKGPERVLEIGTGTGYQTALLAFIVTPMVVSIERIPALASQARAALTQAGVADRVNVITGDGTMGWKPMAPFDAILVAAAGSEVPPPLVAQLADGGRLVIPLATASGAQRLLRVTRRGDATTQEDLGAANFVPLVGRHGRKPDA
ncbi:MAG TPA: protein-L-isoaspartate(D-aspartate) O-methyltransferase [Gemmatimonadales bacterium]